MPWFDPKDQSRPIIEPRKQIESKYPGTKVPVLPEKAVVFCLGKGIPVLKETYPCYQIMEHLPGFITRAEVLGIENVPGICFLHGGRGAPQVACTVETLRVLGVKEILMVGLCGGFGENQSVGDILLPEKIWCEEGTSLHYLEKPGFARVTPSSPIEGIASFFREKGYQVGHNATVTTDAVYRQTFGKERFWRQLGCVGVDMEASALVNLCNIYKIRNTVVLMVSDRHPLSENDPVWEWGSVNFGDMAVRFIQDCVEYALKAVKK